MCDVRDLELRRVQLAAGAHALGLCVLLIKRRKFNEKIGVVWIKYLGH